MDTGKTKVIKNDQNNNNNNNNNNIDNNNNNIDNTTQLGTDPLTPAIQAGILTFYPRRCGESLINRTSGKVVMS